MDFCFCPLGDTGIPKQLGCQKSNLTEGWATATEWSNKLGGMSTTDYLKESTPESRIEEQRTRSNLEIATTNGRLPRINQVLQASTGNHSLGETAI